MNGHGEAGAVFLYTPDTTDPTRLVQRVVLTQNSRGVPGSAETGDLFGYALAMRDDQLAIGAPGEARGSIRKAGLVQPIRWNASSRTYTRDAGGQRQLRYGGRSGDLHDHRHRPDRRLR